MISKEVLKGVLLEQSKRFEKASVADFVIRERLSDVRNFEKIRQSIIITGIRRCGKSVFLLQIMKSLKGKSYYVNFEDERLAKFGLEDFNRLYEVCIELFGKAKTFFLDEVQNIAGWERWVRRMYEDGFKFYITGSNARLLSKELATLLTGRHLQFSLYPFSFKEFLSFRGFELKKEDLYLTERRAEIAKFFSEYLKAGGFPEFLKDNKIEILQEYFNDIVQRDIVERYKVKNIQQLKDLAKFLITNSGNLTTYSQMKKLAELKSVNTAANYFGYLENAYITFKIPLFSFSLKKQKANPFKVFAIDCGMRNSVGFSFSKDLGRSYETIAAIELKRSGMEFFYWKDGSGKEVDFVVKIGQKVQQLIQVCSEIHDPNVRKREISALVKASKELKCKNLLVITSDYEAEEKIDGRLVKFVPLWKWLLT